MGLATLYPSTAAPRLGVLPSPAESGRLPASKQAEENKLAPSQQTAAPSSAPRAESLNHTVPSSAPPPPILIPKQQEELKASVREERKFEEQSQPQPATQPQPQTAPPQPSLFEPKSLPQEYLDQQQMLQGLSLPLAEKEQPRPAHEPAPTSHPTPVSQSVPRIPIPEAVEPERPVQVHQQTVQQAPKMYKPSPIAPTSVPAMGSGQGPMPAEMHPYGPSMPGAMSGMSGIPGMGGMSGYSMQPRGGQMDLLAQIAHLQQQQAQLQGILSSCGMMQPQAQNPYMQMLGYMQNQMMGKMPFMQGPGFGGPSVGGMGRPMPSMMGPPEVQSQYNPFPTSMSSGRMMSGMPLSYGGPSGPRSLRTSNSASPPPSRFLSMFALHLRLAPASRLWANALAASTTSSRLRSKVRRGDLAPSPRPTL